MTKTEWDAEWRACFARLRAKGYRLEDAQRMARAITQARFGRRPSLPVWVSIGLSVLSRKLARMRRAREVTMGDRIFNAVLFGVAAVVGALQASGLPQQPEQWLGLVVVFLTAAWGKFSSNQTLIAPNRPVWTVDERLSGGPK